MTETYTGICVHGGYAEGVITEYSGRSRSFEKKEGSDPAAEIARVSAAADEAVSELLGLSEHLKTRIGRQNAGLFTAHAMILEDPAFRDAIEDTIRTEKCCAEYAVRSAEERLYSRFAAMEDKVTSARAADIRDVSERLLRHLTGGSSGFNEVRDHLKKGTILVTDGLLPTEAAQLDFSRLSAVIERKGSAVSHASILFGMMNVPDIIGSDIPKGCGGRACIVDADAGRIFLDPDERTRETLREKAASGAEAEKLLKKWKNVPTVLPSGRAVPVMVSVAGRNAAEAALACGAEGIGIYRSEFSYIVRPDLPTEEELFGEYRSVAEKMEGRPVVIRTLDIGSDKILENLRAEGQENPALGFRGIRISLMEPDIFRTQLRAIYRASAYGNVSVMFPMVTYPEEAGAARRIAEETRDLLKREGYPVRDIPVGSMIETPAAALSAEELSRSFDFFSIGTNDLIQYTEAADRTLEGKIPFSDRDHTAVLKEAEMVIRAGHAAGIRVGVCGEAAGDLRMAARFVEMGADSLSVSPSDVLPVRKMICGGGEKPAT